MLFYIKLSDQGMINRFWFIWYLFCVLCLGERDLCVNFFGCDFWFVFYGWLLYMDFGMGFVVVFLVDLLFWDF